MKKWIEMCIRDRDKCTTMAALWDQLAAVARVVSTDSSSSRPLVLIS